MKKECFHITNEWADLSLECSDVRNRHFVTVGSDCDPRSLQACPLDNEFRLPAVFNLMLMAFVTLVQSIFLSVHCPWIKAISDENLQFRHKTKNILVLANNFF
jgi:hypothetical protein